MRYLAPEVVSALNAGTLNLRFLLELEFQIDTVRFNSGIGNITFQGAIWYGAGGLGGISNVSQKGDGAANSITYTLAGIVMNTDTRDFLMMAEKYCRQGGTAKLYLALVNSSGAIIGQPVGLACTIMDVPMINDDAGTASITISTEDPLIRQQVGEGLRYTHEDQLHEFPGDMGFEYMAELQDRTI